MSRNDEQRLAAVGALLADDCARQILQETMTEPLSAETLSERCGVSSQTVYRRLDDLVELGLVVEQTQPDPDGHHYNVYTASLDQVIVEVDADGFSIEIVRREPMADRFTSFVEEMR